MTELILVSSEFPPGPGGIGNHAYHLARQLCERGWKVRVITPQDYAAQEEIERFNRSQPFPVITVSSGRGWLREGLARFRALAGQIRRDDATLLLASGRSAVFLAALIAKVYKRRLVAIGHGTEFGLSGFWPRVITRAAYQQAEAIICVSRFTWGLMEGLGIRPRAGTVIHNGADASRFHILFESERRAWARRFGLGEGSVLLTVGSVTDRKGQETVIRALPQILRQYPDARYLMAGLPNEQAKLESLAAEAGVSENIRFLGRVPDEELAGLLNSCDIFLMTSRFTEEGDCEGFGIAVVEAALCGKPAIVSDHSGLSEAVIHGQTGLVVPEGDADIVAESVIRLLGDRVLLQQISEQAHAHALKEQTWQQKGAEYDQFLRKVLEHGE